jgi:hypothetical protein
MSMLSLEDTMTSLKSYGRKEELHAKEARAQASQAKPVAQDFVRTMPPDDTIRRKRAQDDVDAQVRRYDAEAALHDRRAKAAAGGRLLWDKSTKADPEIALKYQGLISACIEHGLIDTA